jgi:membrane-associated phospholipid phosphatase
MRRDTRVRLTLALLSVIAAAPIFGQETKSDKAAKRENEVAAEGDASRSALEVTPGSPTLKTKDITKERKLAPWMRLPRYIVQDQKAIWTSPFHTSKANAKWWAIFGGTTVVLIATDKWTAKQLPNTNDQLAVANWTSRVGAAYSLLPISGAFYFIGLGAGNEHFRETGILGFEALADAAIVGNVIKLTTRRERPLEGNGDGAFWGSKSSVLNASFPSGHAISTWALASVVAHEYPHSILVPIVAYGLATTVSASRFAARKHFASDIIVGGAMGWFIGDWVFAKRHNRELDKPEPALDRLKSHIHIGGPMQARQLDDPDAQRAAAVANLPATN